MIAVVHAEHWVNLTYFASCTLGVNSDSGVSVEYRQSPGRRCGLHPCTQLWVPRWQLQLEGCLHLHLKQTRCPWQWHHGTDRCTDMHIAGK